MNDVGGVEEIVILLISLGVFIVLLIVPLISRLREVKREDFEKRDN